MVKFTKDKPHISDPQNQQYETDPCFKISQVYFKILKCPHTQAITLHKSCYIQRKCDLQKRHEFQNVHTFFRKLPINLGKTPQNAFV